MLEFTLLDLVGSKATVDVTHPQTGEVIAMEGATIGANEARAIICAFRTMAEGDPEGANKQIRNALHMAIARGVMEGDRVRCVITNREGKAIAMARLKDRGSLRNFIEVKAEDGSSFYIRYGDHRIVRK